MGKSQGGAGPCSSVTLTARPDPSTSDFVRELWFGREVDNPDAWPGLERAVDTLCDRLLIAHRRVRGLAAEARDETTPDRADLSSMANQCLQDLPPLPEAVPRGEVSARAAELRVVLMGRTQAGKSTLLEALSHGTGERRGDGRQRYSRDVCARSLPELPEVVVVDTPGVGARDGAEDFDKAFAEIPHGDVIVWVASNDSVQEETARALRMIGVLGKPIIVVLNCRWDLDHPVKRLDFLDNPGLAFRDVEGHLNAIERQLVQAGVTAARVITIHANAAFAATQDTADGDTATLRRNSGIDRLYEVLAEELHERGQQRRALRMVDRVRTPATLYFAALADAITDLATATHTARELTQDLAQRQARTVDRFGELLQAELHRLVDQRRTWHMSIDLGEDIDKKWAAEMDTLHSEVSAVVERHQEDLSRALKEAAQRVVTDWQALPLDQFNLGHFTGFGSVWKNRVGRAAIGLGSGGLGLWGGAIVGAKIGAVAGISGGPVALITAGAGALIGVGVGALVGPLKDYVNRVFRGKAAVLRSRQRELKTKIHPVLDEIDSELDAWRAQVTQRAHATLAEVHATTGESLRRQEDVRDGWTDIAQQLQNDMDALDRETVAATLTLSGRPRLARQVIRASRSAGVATAAEFTGAGFAEAALFPPVRVAERVLPAGPRLHDSPAGQSLPLALGLCQGQIRIDHLSARVARLTLLDDPVPPGIALAWSELLGQFTNSAVEITSTVTPSATAKQGETP